MAAIDDLKQAFQDQNTALSTDLTNLQTALTAELSRVSAALAALPNQDPALQQLTADVQASTTKVHTGLQAAINTLDQELPAP